MIHLVFDVDDTLYNQLSPFEKACDEVFQKYYKILPQALYMTFRKYSDKSFTLTESGEMMIEDMHVYRITEALRDFGIEINRKEALAFQTCYALNQTRIKLLDGMKQVLDFGKRNNLLMGIITNGPTAHQKNKIKQLGMERWIEKEHVFISEEVGVAKPDIRLFHHVQERMDLVPDQTYYIGDNFCNDIKGAKSAGWHAIWFNPRNQAIPQAVPIRPDYTVIEDGKMLEVIKILQNM